MDEVRLNVGSNQLPGGSWSVALSLTQLSKRTQVGRSSLLDEQIERCVTTSSRVQNQGTAIVWIGLEGPVPQGLVARTLSS